MHKVGSPLRINTIRPFSLHDILFIQPDGNDFVNRAWLYAQCFRCTRRANS